ncbi:odorant receptor Or1-like [Cotesia typhae]|uniref:odorant receptor Or1-like n=1 Tax=Cotesia typhae TaxID=2053667 RepID=UPI003D68F1D7
MEAKLPDVLPYRGWLPFNYSQPSIYLLTASQQMVTFFIGCYVDIGFDTLFPGMMLYVSAQINILEHRFKNAVKILHELEVKNSDSELMKNSEKILIGDWVEDHNCVLRFSDYIYGIFATPIFIQYCLSSVILCATVYSLSTIPVFTFEFISCIVYIITTVLQIFLVCMSAHQATLQFADLNDAIYSTDWFKLSHSAQKSMIVIALKTFRPVIFMSGGIITLSLESFKSVIKLSYSIYNVL